MKLSELVPGKTFVLASDVQSIAQIGVYIADNGMTQGLCIYRMGMGATINVPFPPAGTQLVISNDGLIHQMKGDTEIVPCS